MASVEVDLTLEQGSTYAFGLCWGQLAEDADGDPILDGDGNQTTVGYDLTGCTARMQFRLKTPTDVLLTCTTEDVNGGIVLSQPDTVASSGMDVTSNVLTVHAVAHGFAVGDVVQITLSETDTGDSQYVGFYAVTVVGDDDHFSVAYTHANETSTGSWTIVRCGQDNITVVLPDESTDGLIYKTAVHDLKVYWPGGDEDYVIHGNATVRLRVTEDAAV